MITSTAFTFYFELIMCSQLSHMNMSVFRLKELSDKSSRDEHRLATYFMQHMLSAAYQFNPVDVIDRITSTLNIYSKIKTVHFHSIQL